MNARPLAALVLGLVPVACSAPHVYLTVQEPPGSETDTIADAFQALVDADHWRERNAARDRLLAFGAEVLDVVLAGMAHAEVEVRRICHEILRGQFATDERAVEAIIAGLDDEDWGFIGYPSAFHLGEHRIERGREPLRAVLQREGVEPRLLHGAAKSLGELGDADVTVLLWQGLGSDDPYTRYLSNLGMKGLTGKSLEDFEYEGPWEGAFVSGPAVGTVQGQPIEKAEKRVRRWQAVVRFTKWLRGERNDLFVKLEQGLW